MNIQINEHASICIKGGLTLYFDPFNIPGTPHDADIIFITHDHYDHFSPEDIKKVIKQDSWLIVPKTCFKTVADKGFEKIKALDVFDEVCCRGITVRAVPAYNTAKPFHPKQNRWLGYVVNLDGETVYVAGDTDALPENESIQCDIALLPVGGTYTMDVSSAAAFADVLRPKTVIPTHYGSIVGTKQDGQNFTLLLKTGIASRILI